MKKLLLLSVAALSFATPALADDQDIIPGDFSTTVGFTSEYSFRGIAQSNEGPALQGSIDWSHDSGFYAGVWASSVEFTQASVETDIYAGYSGEIGGFTYDLGGIYYGYPGADASLDYDFFEFAAAAGYDFDVAAVSIAANYSPNYFAGSGDALYTAGYVDVPLPFLPFDTALNVNVGHQSISNEVRFGITEESYMDYGIGLSANIEGFDVSLKYIDTNLDEPSECADGCDSRIIATVTKTLP